MDVANRTRGKLLELPMLGRAGREISVVIVKYTFRRTPAGPLALDRETPAEIDLAEVPWDPAEPLGSARRPGQAYDEKPGTEVLLVGHAFTRSGESAVDVRLRAGPIDKTVRAHGLRVWQRGTFGGLAPGPALPLREPIPLRWELAWGGTDTSDPKRPVSEPTNPLGRGVVADLGSLLDQPAAQLEDPAFPVGTRGQRAACFGPTGRHWQPRAAFAGTYDAAWQETRMPLLPTDFDPRFQISAPADQWSPRRLSSDLEVAITGTARVASWSLRLPRITVAVTKRAGSSTSTHEAALDTFLIDADDESVELTFRAAIEMPKKRDAVDELRITDRWGA